MNDDKGISVVLVNGGHVSSQLPDCLALSAAYRILPKREAFVTKNRNAVMVDASAKWFSGETVPISFIVNSLITHQVHHQGAITQILDELKVDNDFSGISAKFLAE